ncbi:unnamed protein product, partial [Rotaria magnacalcarata]
MDDHDALLIALLVIVVIFLGFIITFIICWRIRKRRQYNEFRSSSEETGLITRISQPRIERAQAQERASLLTCHFYIRTAGEYTFHSQLYQLGSNPEKSWFLVTPTSRTTSALSMGIASHLLTIQPKSDRLNYLNDEESTTTYFRTLNNLFSRLFHPYVEPIIKVDALYTQKSVVTVKQYQRLGSLKDILHGVVPTAKFNGKYSYRSSGLSLERVRLYSRQLIEGLLFLQSKSMPPIVDLHSGNIIVVGPSIQIGSYENQFLEQRTRIYSLVKRATSSLILPDGMTRAQACEVFCFGGVLFEMIAGYELGEQLRGLTPKHWHDCGRDPDARQMLTRLFDIAQPVLTLTEIRQLPYFSKSTIELKELRNFTPMPGEYSNDVKILLEQWTNTMRKKRNPSMKTSIAEKRKNSAVPKQMETSIINLSYTPTTSSSSTTTTKPSAPLSSPMPPPVSQQTMATPPPPP